jgi:uncharacterized protein (TIGR00255 family)
MTGFGAAQRVAGGLLYQVEIRGVNNRYLKLSLKLPDFLQFAEPTVERLLRDRLSRGSVSCSLRVKGESGSSVERINMGVLQGYVNELARVTIPKGLNASIDLGALASMPGVCEPPLIEDDQRAAQTVLIESLLGEALDAMMSMRRDEGKALRADLLGLLAGLREQLDRVKERAPVVVDEYHERLRNRVAMLMEKGGFELEAQGLIREVAIFADRCDVAEEVSRLGSHIEQFVELCDRGERVGRTLDFLTQELHREANTIGSKTSDLGIARCVVEMKSLVDRLKEQVQNVE